MTEQLPQFELMVREYEKTSGNQYPDDLKVAAVVSALPSTLRMHIQMHITEKTTYEDVKRRIELVEQVSTVWTADSGMQMPMRAQLDDDSGVAPMEVDAVWAKGSGKYGKDGKGGKKGVKGKEKGKKGEKGKFSPSFQKGKDGKGKKGKSDSSGKGKGVQCFNCGRYGHRARECWSPKKVNKVEEQTEHGNPSNQSTSPSTSSSGGSLTSAAAYNKAQAVRMVRIEEDEECSGSPGYSVFDLTEFEESDQEGFERVRMVAEKEEAVFFECFEIEDETLSSSIPLQVPWISMDIQDDEDEVRSQSEIMHRVCMVKENHDNKMVAMTLDSGADISVAPMCYGGIGEPGLQRHVRMVDAQGQDIATSGNRKLRLSAETRDGQSVQFVENFALGNVSHPLMCMGKLLRQGWTLQKDGCGLFLRHEASEVDIPARLERNSLVMDVKVCAVVADEEEGDDSGGAEVPDADGREEQGPETSEPEVEEIDESLRICILKGYISRELVQLETLPGWHVLPNGVVVHSDPVAVNFLDPSGNYGPEWPARMTLMKSRDADGQWIQLENSYDYRALAEPYRRLTPGDGAQRTLTFISPRKLKDYFILDSEVPVSQYPLLGEEAAWPSDDEEEKEGGEDAPLAAGAAGDGRVAVELEVAEDDPLEVTIDESVLNMGSKLKTLQEWCKKLTLPTSGGKAKCLRRLQRYKLEEEQRISLEISKKLFAEEERRPLAMRIPKLPTKMEQDIHNLTHLPFAGWCQSCVATRAKEDLRRQDERSDKKDRGRSVISFDYGYTYVRGEPEEKQYGTVLYVAESETKAVLAVPVLAKGSISLKQVTEEIVRFTMATSSGQAVVLQADGERSTRQILRAVQHCRAQLGLSTEIRITGVGQHASNGQAERTVQTVRKLANCLRNQAESKASAQIRGSSDLYPWSFRHAAWLVTRYRVINGSTSFELMTDRKYSGRLVLFGESVMYKDITALKGEPVYKRGVWAGRSTWSDSHIVLTPKGAVEARSIRRLPQQFHAEDMVAARGLPWNYSTQGILMKHRSTMMRPAIEIEEVDEDEENKRARQAGQAVAMGLITPAQGGATTPGMAAPETPGALMIPRTPMARIPEGASSSSAMKGEEDEDIFAEEPSERISKKREVEDVVEESPKRGRVEVEMQEMRSGESKKRPAYEDLDVAEVGSPKRLRKIQAEFPDGDEEYEDEIIMAAAEQHMEQDDRVEDDADGPPDTYDEDLAELDEEAEIEEEKRLIKMGVLIKLEDGAQPEEGSYNITTKMVITWKHRQEKGGWFRRARLVARQYKWSVYTDDSFAPTSAYVILKLLLHRCIMDEKMVVHIADIKDAFLMVDQPEDEKATVTRRGVTYKLGKVLPGQRTAASQWFSNFKKKAEDYGMECDVMQPSLMRRKICDHSGSGRLYLTIHVDDLLMVGDEGEAEKFFEYLRSFGWSLESQGPMEVGEKFEYLKRKMRMTENGVIIRPDTAHIDDIAKICNKKKKAPRKTPTTTDFSKLATDPSEDEELSPDMQYVYRSCVGKLLYLAPDRPDVQFVAQGLSSFMKTPTWRAWLYVEHVSSYLFGTRGEGLFMEATWPGRSVLNVNGSSSSHDEYVASAGQDGAEEKNLLEVICDADYAGNQRSRKSLSSVQLYMDGNLLESYVRSQKSIALSSGESEYVCMVGGVSEAMFLQHCWQFLTGKKCDIRCRSDSSAARSLAGRVGIGRIRHLAANLLWLQEKVNNKVIEVTAIPTEINPADAGTKSLSRARMNGLKRIMKFVSEDDTWIGQEEYEAMEQKEEVRKATKKFAKSVGGNAKVAMIVAMTLLQGSKGDPVMGNNQLAPLGFEEKPDTTKNSRGDILFLMMAIFAIFGALSLVALCCWFGRSMVERGKAWFVKMTSTGDAKKMLELKELAAQRGVKIKMLEIQLEDLKKSQSEEKDRLMKMLTEERENRQSLVNREVATRRDVSLTNRQIGAITHELTKLKVVVTKAGEAHHDVNCRFVHPPHSHSGMQYRACSECMPKAVKGVLESLGRSYSCGHTGT